MIFDRLIIHDFGIYKGRHVIDLCPEAPSRPVILIGARNGRGKTTILDAVNLVLFGQRARLSNRGQLSWDEYLRRSIHRGAQGGASITLQFVVSDVFEERRYEVTRHWNSTRRGVKESLDVTVNGVVDKVVAEDWSDHIEELLPLDIASLHFFDGEKIDQLADPSLSRNVIGAAIRGLLGLGVLERLGADLKVLIRRKQDNVIGQQGSELLQQLDDEITTLRARRTASTMEVAQARTALERQQEVVRRLEEEARRSGADKWERRELLRSRESELRQHIATVDHSLQTLAAGAMPLGLARALLERAIEQTAQDAATQRAIVALEVLEDRDSEVLARCTASVAEELQPILAADRSNRRHLAERHMVHSEPFQQEALLRVALDDLDDAGSVSSVLSELDSARQQLNEVEREISMVPADEQLSELLQELGRGRQQLDDFALQHQALAEEIEHIDLSLERMEARADRLRQEEADRLRGELDDQRICEYAQRAIETLGRVSSATVERNLGQIEVAVLDRFSELIGKKDLVGAVRIDPTTLELSIVDAGLSPLPVDRLSAGERQLLATAVVWGLSTVAGRHIPLVIDTPLGRLDQAHRQHVVNNYFPRAAEQVIILSTDSEIDDSLYEQIKPFVSREYVIQFRDSEASSELVAGFFAGSSSAN